MFCFVIYTLLLAKFLFSLCRQVCMFAVPELDYGKRYHNVTSSLWSVISVFRCANSAFNFIVYYRMGSRFRQTLWLLLRSCGSRFCCLGKRGIDGVGSTISTPHGNNRKATAGQQGNEGNTSVVHLSSITHDNLDNSSGNNMTRISNGDRSNGNTSSSPCHSTEVEARKRYSESSASPQESDRSRCTTASDDQDNSTPQHGRFGLSKTSRTRL